MIEIIPNWHPLFVHFTVGLLSVAVIFYFLTTLLPKQHRWKQQWLNMANWSLWSGCLFATATVTAGWLAYNSVAHDATSHAAMTLHRNWALPTAATFLLIGLWATVLARKDRQPGLLFLTFSAIAAMMLMVTGWLGAEAVYRYGLGVISLPKVEMGSNGTDLSSGSGHQHAHGPTAPDATLQTTPHPSDKMNKPADTVTQSEASSAGRDKSRLPVKEANRDVHSAVHEHKQNNSTSGESKEHHEHETDINNKIEKPMDHHSQKSRAVNNKSHNHKH